MRTFFKIIKTSIICLLIQFSFGSCHQKFWKYYSERHSFEKVRKKNRNTFVKTQNIQKPNEFYTDLIRVYPDVHLPKDTLAIKNLLIDYLCKKNKERVKEIRFVVTRWENNDTLAISNLVYSFKYFYSIRNRELVLNSVMYPNLNANIVFVNLTKNHF